MKFDEVDSYSKTESSRSGAIGIQRLVSVRICLFSVCYVAEEWGMGGGGMLQ